MSSPNWDTMKQCGDYWKTILVDYLRVRIHQRISVIFKNSEIIARKELGTDDKGAVYATFQQLCFEVRNISDTELKYEVSHMNEKFRNAKKLINNVIKLFYVVMSVSRPSSVEKIKIKHIEADEFIKACFINVISKMAAAHATFFDTSLPKERRFLYYPKANELIEKSITSTILEFCNVTSLIVDEKKKKKKRSKVRRSTAPELEAQEDDVDNRYQPRPNSPFTEENKKNLSEAVRKFQDSIRRPNSPLTRENLDMHDAYVTSREVSVEPDPYQDPNFIRSEIAIDNNNKSNQPVSRRISSSNIATNLVSSAEIPRTKSDRKQRDNVDQRAVQNKNDTKESVNIRSSKSLVLKERKESSSPQQNIKENQDFARPSSKTNSNISKSKNQSAAEIVALKNTTPREFAQPLENSTSFRQHGETFPQPTTTPSRMFTPRQTYERLPEPSTTPQRSTSLPKEPTPIKRVDTTSKTESTSSQPASRTSSLRGSTSGKPEPPSVIIAEKPSPPGLPSAIRLSAGLPPSRNSTTSKVQAEPTKNDSAENVVLPSPVRSTVDFRELNDDTDDSDEYEDDEDNYSEVSGYTDITDGTVASRAASVASLSKTNPYNNLLQ
jgi:hypothetical protein